LRRFDQAEPLLVSAHAILHSRPGPSASQLAESKTRLVALYEAWGKPEPAARAR
jgi:hypothetical protein